MARGIEKTARERVDLALESLPELARLLASDVDAAYSSDPAAAGLEQVLLSYPCIQAITVQRLAHRLYHLEIPYIPRMMTEAAHSHTGIDIHPGAAIGESFFIDHGTGVVIGETATIGKRVTLYHGVTLGAFNPLVKDDLGQLRRGQSNKRHPDLEDHVTVYPNATILGGQTRVGHHSVIGGNVWLTHSVVPYSKVVGKIPNYSFTTAARSRWASSSPRERGYDWLVGTCRSAVAHPTGSRAGWRGVWAVPLRRASRLTYARIALN